MPLPWRPVRSRSHHSPRASPRVADTRSYSRRRASGARSGGVAVQGRRSGSPAAPGRRRWPSRNGCRPPSKTRVPRAADDRCRLRAAGTGHIGERTGPPSDIGGRIDRRSRPDRSSASAHGFSASLARAASSVFGLCAVRGPAQGLEPEVERDDARGRRARRRDETAEGRNTGEQLPHSFNATGPSAGLSSLAFCRLSRSDAGFTLDRSAQRKREG